MAKRKTQEVWPPGPKPVLDGVQSILSDTRDTLADLAKWRDRVPGLSEATKELITATSNAAVAAYNSVCRDIERRM